MEDSPKHRRPDETRYTRPEQDSSEPRHRNQSQKKRRTQADREISSERQQERLDALANRLAGQWFARSEEEIVREFNRFATEAEVQLRIPQRILNSFPSDPGFIRLFVEYMVANLSPKNNQKVIPQAFARLADGELTIEDGQLIVRYQGNR